MKKKTYVCVGGGEGVGGVRTRRIEVIVKMHKSPGWVLEFSGRL